MTLHVLKLHVKKVHRISCVKDFVCPKCNNQVFSSQQNNDDQSGEVINAENDYENSVHVQDKNLMNQG